MPLDRPVQGRSCRGGSGRAGRAFGRSGGRAIGAAAPSARPRSGTGIALGLVGAGVLAEQEVEIGADPGLVHGRRAPRRL